MRVLRGLLFVAALSIAWPAIADRLPVANKPSVTTLDPDTFCLLGAGIVVVASLGRKRRSLTTRDAIHRFTIPRRTPSRGGGAARTSV